jgi:hypothetical protein
LTRTLGSARGAASNGGPYRNQHGPARAAFFTTLTDTPGGHTRQPDRPDSGNRPHPHGFCDSLISRVSQRTPAAGAPVGRKRPEGPVKVGLSRRGRGVARGPNHGSDEARAGAGTPTRDARKLAGALVVE